MRGTTEGVLTLLHMIQAGSAGVIGRELGFNENLKETIKSIPAEVAAGTATITTAAFLGIKLARRGSNTATYGLLATLNAALTAFGVHQATEKGFDDPIALATCLTAAFWLFAQITAQLCRKPNTQEAATTEETEQLVFNN